MRINRGSIYDLFSYTYVSYTYVAWSKLGRDEIPKPYKGTKIGEVPKPSWRFWRKCTWKHPTGDSEGGLEDMGQYGRKDGVTVFEGELQVVEGDRGWARRMGVTGRKWRWKLKSREGKKGRALKIDKELVLIWEQREQGKRFKEMWHDLFNQWDEMTVCCIHVRYLNQVNGRLIRGGCSSQSERHQGMT